MNCGVVGITYSTDFQRDHIERKLQKKNVRLENCSVFIAEKSVSSVTQ